MAADGPVVEEIACLLDQCSPEELANILQAIDGGDLVDVGDLLLGADENTSAPAAVQAFTLPPAANGAPMSPQVQPPAGPPPGPGGRRPVPAGVKRSASGQAGDEEQQITLKEAKKLLDDHSSAVVTEVKRMVPYMAASSGGGESLDLETLTKVLAARDDEVKELEATLSMIQAELSSKDRRVADLGGELDHAIREVRHRQLDLEFQQLKLEETVRNNSDMEQAQRNLMARVEEAGLSARHAALDVDMGRSMPGMMRVQGSLPWAVRKSRPASTASGLV